MSSPLEPTAFSPDPDALLMQEAGRGDRAAFESLMRKYYRRIYNFIGRYVGDAALAEDLSQEVFLKAFQAAPNYQPQAKFQTWLYTIARNTALNSLRGCRRTVSLDETLKTEDGEVALQIPDPSVRDTREKLKDEELAVVVREAIDSLPENQRLAVILRRYENLSYEDIADTLGVSVPAVKSLLSRAKVNLQERLRDAI